MTWRILILIFLLISACTSTSEFSKYGRGSAPAHSAAYTGDAMNFSKRQPERERNDFDFFYKRCSIDERYPFPKGAVWECTSP